MDRGRELLGRDAGFGSEGGGPLSYYCSSGTGGQRSKIHSRYSYRFSARPVLCTPQICYNTYDVALGRELEGFQALRSHPAERQAVPLRLLVVRGTIDIPCQSEVCHFDLFTGRHPESRKQLKTQHRFLRQLQFFINASSFADLVVE